MWQTVNSDDDDEIEGDNASTTDTSGSETLKSKKEKKEKKKKKKEHKSKHKKHKSKRDKVKGAVDQNEYGAYGIIKEDSFFHKQRHDSISCFLLIEP